MSGSATVTTNKTAVINASGPTTFCPEKGVTLSAALTGGTYTTGAPTSYLWNNAATSSSITANQTGTSSVTINLDNGCSTNASVATTALVTSVDAGSDVTICRGSSTQLIAAGTPNGGTGGTYNVCIYDAPGGSGGCNFNFDNLCSDGYQNFGGSSSNTGTLTTSGAVTPNTLQYKVYFTNCSGAITFTLKLNGHTVQTNSSSAASCACIGSGSGTYPLTFTVPQTAFGPYWSNSGTNTFTMETSGGNIYISGEVATLTVPASSYSWSPSASLSNRNISNPVATPSATTTYTVTYTSPMGCLATDQVDVKMNNEAPVPAMATLPTITGECAATVTVVPSANDYCSGVIAGTTTDALSYSTQGTHTITWKYTDADGISTTQTQNVVIADVTRPVVPTLADVTGECSATATVPATTDNCAGTVTGTTTDALTYNTQGTHVITWTFDDGNGNVSTATQNVVIDDITPPAVPTLANVTGECSATATAPATTDNCAGTVTGTTTDAVTYNTQGTHVITWTFDDGNGNVSTATQNVVIADVTKPVVPTLATVTGECSATATVPSTTDNCAGTIVGTTTDALTYSTQGTHVITWAFDDGNGNISTATQNVVIDDITPPVVPTLADVTGECSATATNPTTTDNCAGTVIGATTDALTYSTQGTHVITWTFNDGNGNVSTATQNVVIADVTNPVVPVLADVTGECSATATVPTTTDNCAGTITGTTTDAITYNTQGTHVITWSFNDGNGNVSTATQNVVIADVTKPVVPTLATVTGECSATATVPTTTDNCTGTVTGSTTDALSYNTQGTHVITWTFNDGNGNVSTATQNVVIADVTNPAISSSTPSAVAACNGATANNNYTLTATAADNCHVASFGWVAKDQNGNTLASGNGGTANASFPIGSNSVIWTAKDDAGNVLTKSSALTIWPVPTVSVANQTTFCKLNTIYIGYGPSSLNYTAIGGGGTGALSYSWGGGYSSTATKNVSGAGTYTVTVKDANGCTATAGKTVAVKDVRCGNNLDKVMVCHNTGGTNPGNAVCISPSAVATHLSAHNDCLGDCTSSFAKGTAVTHLDLEGGNIVVFPNPASGRINVELKEMGSPYRSYQITDINGRVLLSQQFQGDMHSDLISVDISSLIPGMYIIRAITDNGASLTKFTVQ
jgi:hypothetical protein